MNLHQNDANADRTNKFRHWTKSGFY